MLCLTIKKSRAELLDLMVFLWCKLIVYGSSIVCWVPCFFIVLVFSSSNHLLLCSHPDGEE